jgi:hypothetical protein
MHAQLKNGTLLLRIGTRFGTAEAERVCEATRAFAPLRQLTLDFTDVRDFEQSACAVVAKMLSERFGRKVVLLGVTPGQSRMLKYLGVECTRSEPGRT